MTPALYAACEQSLHVIKADGAILRAGRASLFILENLGWGRTARCLARPPFVWIIELGYKITAASRPPLSYFFRKE